MTMVSSTVATVNNQSRGRLIYIQYLRGIAAMMVVVEHTLNSALSRGWSVPITDFGLPGVMIFFVISGFIMMHVCRDEPPITFIIRRIIRIVPLYWIMTCIFFAIVFLNDFEKGAPFQRVPDFVASLLFIPHYSTAVPNQIWPILVPGWTLNYEMFFFLIFSIGLVLGSVRFTASFLLVGLLLLGLAVNTNNPIFLTWTNTYLILFLAGMGLAWLWPHITFARMTSLFPFGLGIIVAAAIGVMPNTWVNPCFYVGSILTVTGTLALQEKRPKFQNRVLCMLGDASYSIYLLHTILMIAIFKVFNVIPVEELGVVISLSILNVSICAAAGIACYLILEKPMLKAMRKRLE